ncbi:MAG TPA: tetratricopeptide repeat protein [Actinomycetota bacterium]
MHLDPPSSSAVSSPLAATAVVDVTDATFEQVVIEGSKERPVVVDLWASWCAPCRTLGPTLEKVAGERDGAFLLAKLDVDANSVGNALLQAVRSQGIPTVVAFRDGEPVNMFIGAYPEEEVNRFVDELLPSPAEVEAEVASDREAVGDLDAAEAGYREALASEPGNRDASVGLARILMGRGDAEEARVLVEPLLPDADADHILAQIRVAGWADLAPATPLDQAKSLAAQGEVRGALDAMLAAFETDPAATREAMVDVFTALGIDDPVAAEYRPKLASRLF